MLGALVLGLVGVVGGLWDARTRRIPDALTLGSLALAMGLGAWEGQLVTTLEGGALGGLPFLVLSLFLPVGGGDVKLAAALGALGAVYLGLPGTVAVLGAGTLAGGVLSLVLGRKVLGAAVWAMLSGDLGTGFDLLKAAGKEVWVPYGVALGAGALAVALAGLAGLVGG